MRIYLDVCCLSRLTDDQIQPRVRAEAAAISEVFVRSRQGLVTLLYSQALRAEARSNPAEVRREHVQSLLGAPAEFIRTNAGIVERARYLVAERYGSFDALHLASAEAGDADFLLSTDDHFIRLAARGAGSPRVRVLNPVSWKQETAR